MTAKQRLAAIAEHAENVHRAMEADGETGSHHRNNTYAQVWCRQNVFLSKWITELLELTRATPEPTTYNATQAARAIHHAVHDADWEQLHRIFQVAVDPEAEFVPGGYGGSRIESEIVPIKE